MLTRRQFLLFASMTPLSLKSLVDGAAGAKPVPAGKGQRVIVIGAGAAGIAAARRLTDAGFPVMLLEARQRIGGRIQTSSDFAAPLDLGAAWIHGIHGNPLTKLAGDYNVKTLATPYDDIQAFSSKGGGYSMEALGNAFEAFEKAMSRAKEKAEGWDADPSLAKAMAADLNLMTGKDAGQAAISSFQGEMGADLEELSTWWTEEDDAFDGEDYLLAQGYGAILNQLVQGLNLHPGQAVKEVKQRATHVEVKTQDRTYDCDVVVVTLPLGVLKAGAVRFEPALPLEKREAIQRLGMGVLNKVVLQFPQEGPWPFKKPWITVVPGEQGRYSEFLNMAPVTGKRILVHLAGGSEARRLETMDEGQLVAALLKVLRSATGASLAAPVKHAVTRWHSDPFSLGAYSHCAPGSSFKDMERLAAPVDSKLFFAGEATAVIPSGNRNRYYPGTVHGAWLSGLREADRIIAGFMGGKGGKKAYK